MKFSNWRYILSLFFSLFLGSLLRAQEIIAIEYFFDHDPGLGSANAITITEDSNIDFTFNADVSGLSNGLHTFHVRAKDQNGKWSLLSSSSFARLEGTGGDERITSMEYFFDDDPGLGSATPITITEDNNIDLTFNADVSDLSNGLHTFHIRAKDQNGRWSLLNSSSFVRLEGTGGDERITAMEYFFDHDPGLGSATPITVAEDSSIDLTFNANVSDLSNGLHTINIRTKDQNGKWSLLNSSSFIRLEGTGGDPQIIEIEYFFNEDPGFGNGIPLTFNSSLSVDSTFVVPLPDFPAGEQQFYIRVKDQNGRWSLLNQQSICLPEAKAGFETARFGNRFSFIDQSRGASEYLWDFDDGLTDTLSNPVHDFSPGEYNVIQIVSNECSSDTTQMHLSILGIENFEPKVGGNSGEVTLTVYGGSLTQNVGISLIGAETILPNDTTLINSSELNVTFDLRDKLIGDYEVTVTFPNGDVIRFEEYFTIEHGELASVSANIVGSSVFRPGRPSKFNLSAFNTSNVDAVGVPIWIAVEDLEGLAINLIEQISIPDSFPSDDINYDSLGLTIKTNRFFGIAPTRADSFIVFPLYLPVLPANSSRSLEFSVTSFSQFSIYSIASKPFFNSPLNENIPSCLYNVAANALLNGIADEIDEEVEEFLEELIPLYPCIQFSETRRENKIEFFESEQGILDVASLYWNHTTAVWDCMFSIFPAKKAAKTVQRLLEFVADVEDDVIEEYKELQEHLETLNDFLDCLSPYYEELVPSEFSVNPIRAFDPNEKYSSNGPGDENFINQFNIDYEIAFENVDTATAAAQIVTLIDTLDLELFDINTLHLNYFIIDDSTYSIPSNRSEYTSDVDLRPDNDLLVRFNARVDTTTGIMNIQFLSLDPDTMELTEDVFAGFLPPNVAAPEGEGRVGFSISLKNDLPHGTEIRNKASIIFDFNEAIITNETLNTLDLTLPSSTMNSISQYQKDTLIDISWAGSDVGSGVFSYDIYQSTNGGEFELFDFRTNETGLTFDAHQDSTYSFFVVASDSVGNVESKDPTSELLVEVGESYIVKPDSLSFGSIDIDNSTSQTLTIENSGTVDLIISEIEYPEGFTSETNEIEIEAGESQSINVTFAPTNGISYQDTLFIHSDAENESVSTIILNGIGTTRILDVADVIEFDSVDVNLESNLTVSLINNGNDNLVISEISYPDGFQGSISDTVIAPSSVVELVVIFAPIQALSYSGLIQFSSNANVAGTETVVVSGVGTLRSLDITNASFEFGLVDILTESDQTISLYNNGNDDLRISEITFPSGYSSVISSLDIPSGEESKITVTFYPQDTINYQGEIILTSDANENPSDTIEVSGFGASRILDISNSLDFGKIDINTTSNLLISLGNTGNDQLEVNHFSYPTLFSGSSSTLVIEPSESINLEVAFSPEDTTSILEYLVIESNSNIRQLDSIVLTGQGALRQLQTTSSVDFDSVDVGTESVKNIRVSNVGNDSVNITEILFPSGFFADMTEITLGPKEYKDLPVSFSPIDTLEYGGAIYLKSNANVSIKDSTLVLGYGVSRELAINGELNFEMVDVNSAARKSIQIRNDGNQELEISEIQYPEGFSGSFNNLILEKGEEQTIEIVFSPIQFQIYEDSIKFQSNATTGMRSIYVFGSVNDLLGFEIISKDLFEIYPNPTQESLNIKWPIGINPETVSFHLYSNAGKEVMSFEPVGNQNDVQLDLKELRSGTYILIIRIDEKSSFSRIIKL